MWQCVTYAKGTKEKIFNPRVTSPPTHSQPEMGRDINGIHRWVTSVGRKGQKLCSGRSINQICTLHGNKKTDMTKQIANVFCKNIYKLHGFPKVIVSDRDAKFNGKFWRQFFKQVGTSLNMSSTYHPQTDGHTKVVNKYLESYLRCFVTDKENHQSQWLHLAE